MAEIVGAKGSEVTLMNTLSVNLHLMLTSSIDPLGKRTKILIEEDVFPSDRYAVESQIEWHGLSIEENLIYIERKKGNETIDSQSLKEILDLQGDEIALIMLGGVNYYTGHCLIFHKSQNGAMRKAVWLDLILHMVLATYPWHFIMLT